MSTTSARRGRFLTFEGPDGCGKSTQMRRLADRLRAAGRTVLETAEPGGTAIGKQIRQVLLDPGNQELSPTAEMLLYFASRAQAVDQWIKPALDRGEVVLSDRFTDSTLAYQGGGRELGRDVVLQLHAIACHGLNPDLTVLIDIDVPTTLARTGGRGPRDRMDGQAAEFHKRVRQAYLELADLEPRRIALVDGHGTIEQVAARVWQVVKDHV